MLLIWHAERAERREAKGCFPSHFVDQGDRSVPDIEKAVSATLHSLSLCIKRVVRAESRRV